MDRPPVGLSGRLSPRLVFGLAVMALGALLTLDNLGILDARPILRFWPVALIAIGAAKLTQPPEACQRTSGFIWLSLGVAFLLSSLRLIELDQLWPLALLLLGARMVWKAVERRPRPSRAERIRRALADPEGAAEGAPRLSSESVVSSFAVMGGVSRGTNSDDFRGGEAVAIMGGCEIDLRRARMRGGEAVIDTLAIWGGVDIYVPEDWEVVNKGFALMGGFGDETKRPAEPKGRLVVTGLAIMGGVEISN